MASKKRTDIYNGLRPTKGRFLCRPRASLIMSGSLRHDVDYAKLDCLEIGGIAVPERAISTCGDVCTVLAESPRIGDPRGLVGRDVLVHAGTRSDFMWRNDEELSICPLYAITGVLYEGVWVDIDEEGMGTSVLKGEPGVRRCRWCKSAGTLNELLGAGGYCPKCKRYPDGRKWTKPKVVEDKYGNKKTIYTENLSREEEELYGGTDDGKPKPKQIISYADQRRRG